MMLPEIKPESDGPVLEALQKTSPNQFAMIAALQANPQLNYKELSAQFGIPIGTAKSRLNRIRGKIAAWRQDRILPRRG